MTSKTPWCCTGYVSECPLCPEYGTRMIDPCPGHPPVDENQQAVDTARLHAERRHPDYEYATTHGPRKQWDESDRPPAGENSDPDHTWSPNVDAGRPGMGWDRFEYHEEAYWRRPKTRSGPQEVDGIMGGAEAPAADLQRAQAEIDRLTAELADYDERAEQQKLRAEAAEQHLRNIAQGGPRADAVQAEIGEMIAQTHELRDQLRRAEAAIERARTLAARWENALAPDHAYARSLHAALDDPQDRP